MSPDFMRHAIALALENVRSGSGGPFAALIVKEGRIIAEGANRVTRTNDPTAHAEVVAIREACRVLADFQLTGCDLYTTCEPCPMCMAALHWSRVETVYYGATIADADSAGFNELQLPAAELLRLGGSKLNLIPNVLQKECCKLFDEWKANPQRVVY